MDYSAYTEKDINSYNGKLDGLPKLTSPKIGQLLSFLVVTLLFIFLYILITVLLTVVWVYFLFIGFIMFVPFMLLIWKKFGKLTTGGNDFALRMALFAKRNKFTYTMAGPVYDSKGTISSVLGNPMTSNLVTGDFEGAKFKLFTTYGKGFYVVLKVTLPNKYPHILLDVNTNDFIVSNLLNNFPNSKKITLEGDFNEKFTVYSAGSSVETLQILSPELMLRMLDYPRQADIEIVGNDLQLVMNYKVLTEQDIKMLFESASQILRDVGTKSNNSRVKFNSAKRI